MPEVNLFAAIRDQDAALVRSALASGTSLTTIKDGHLPLTLAACFSRNKEVVAALLAAGADVNGRTKSGATALHCATANGLIDIVKLLISHGADLSATNNEGHAPLQDAAFHGQLRAACELIAAGANLDAAANESFTALQLVAGFKGKRHTQIAAALVEAGADVNIGPPSALMRACEEGNADIARLLIEAGADVNAKDIPGGSVLMNAAYSAHVPCVELLIESGVDLAYRAAATHGDWANLTALEVARQEKKSKIARLLEAAEVKRKSNRK